MTVLFADIVDFSRLCGVVAPEDVVMAFAIDMLRATRRHGGFRGQPIRIRVGINEGPVVAGVMR